MNGIPRIKEVIPADDLNIVATFDNGIKKKYDVMRMVNKYSVFGQLRNKALFNMVKVDCGGFGIIWNDEIDLSEYEIWQNGVQVN
jgi:hypothetical protein